MSTDRYAKPDWVKGDVVVGVEGSGVSCAFVAEFDPTYSDGRSHFMPVAGWYYVYCPAGIYRKATAADLERKIGYAEQDVQRETERLCRLRDLLAMVNSSAGAAAGPGAWHKQGE